MRGLLSSQQDLQPLHRHTHSPHTARSSPAPGRLACQARRCAHPFHRYAPARVHVAGRALDVGSASGRARDPGRHDVGHDRGGGSGGSAGGGRVPVPRRVAELLTAVSGKADAAQLPEEYRLAAADGNPFGLFTLTMTEGTITAGRAFGAWGCPWIHEPQTRRRPRSTVPPTACGNNCGAGPFLSNDPAPLRVPARHASGAGRGISRGLRCTGLSHQGTGRWDPAVIRPTLTVTVGQATTVTGAALHSVKSRTMELWRSHRRRAGRATPPAGVFGCGRRSFDISVGGTDVRRITGHMAAAQPSWMGGNPRTVTSPPALLNCGGGGSSRRPSARGSGPCGPCDDCRREHGCRLTHLPPASIGLEPGEQRPGGRSFRGDGLRRHGLRGNEVLMCGSPHTARRRTRSPVARAFRTPAPRIRCMGSEQSPPPMGQSGQLTACDRQQRTIVGAVCQLVEHVEPLPHSLPEDLAQNLVHLATPPFRARFAGLEVCAPAASRELQSRESRHRRSRSGARTR